MRLFLGLEIPPEIVSKLDPLFFGLPGANWVKKEELHITLRFLGEINILLYLIVDLLIPVITDEVILPVPINPKFILIIIN